MKKNTVGFIYSPKKNIDRLYSSLASKLLSINDLVEVKEVANTNHPNKQLSLKPAFILIIE